MLVGGVDPEMTDPRLNEDTLQRVARASGGPVLAPAIVQTLIDRLKAARSGRARVRRDLWNTGWSFAMIARVARRRVARLGAIGVFGDRAGVALLDRRYSPSMARARRRRPSATR